MKKTLSVALCLMPVFTMSAYAASSLLPVFIQTKAECIASCTSTHCCSEGRYTTRYNCPDGWTSNLSGTTCERASTTTYSETTHRYTTTNYSTCTPTSESFQVWTCTNYSSSGSGASTTAWTSCCVLNGSGGCNAISLL